MAEEQIINSPNDDDFNVSLCKLFGSVSNLIISISILRKNIIIKNKPAIIPDAINTIQNAIDAVNATNSTIQSYGV